MFLQSWVSIKRPGQRHEAHTHANSVISGVYYWEPVQQPIAFLNPKTVEIGITQSNFNTSFTLNEIKPGSLVLFPSYLKHWVPINDTDLPRKSLAFNTIPTTGFGNESQCTEIDLQRLKNKLLPR